MDLISFPQITSLICNIGRKAGFFWNVKKWARILVNETVIGETFNNVFYVTIVKRAWNDLRRENERLK